MPHPAYPERARGDVGRGLIRQAVADPYRWLENDVRGDPQGARLGGGARTP